MMTLYSGTTCLFSQRCRIVLYEKGMDFQIIDVDLYNKPEDLAVMNPYNRTPVLVERDLILYESNIINEYIDAIEGGTQKQAEKARQIIRDNLTQIAPVFVKQKYMLGEEFSMLDVAIAPLLWRLDHYGIQLGKQATPLMKYAERLFSRPAFIEALTAPERVMRK